MLSRSVLSASLYVDTVNGSVYTASQSFTWTVATLALADPGVRVEHQGLVRARLVRPSLREDC